MPVILYILLIHSLFFYYNLFLVAEAVCRSNHDSVFVICLPVWMSDFQKLFLLLSYTLLYFFSLLCIDLLSSLLFSLAASLPLCNFNIWA